MPGTKIWHRKERGDELGENRKIKDFATCYEWHESSCKDPEYKLQVKSYVDNLELVCSPWGKRIEQSPCQNGTASLEKLKNDYSDCLKLATNESRTDCNVIETQMKCIAERVNSSCERPMEVFQARLALLPLLQDYATQNCHTDGVLFAARVSFIACQNNNIDTSTPSRHVRGGDESNNMWTATFLRHKRTPPPTNVKNTNCSSSNNNNNKTTTTAAAMGTDINNQLDQQAHNIPCVHPHRPPPIRANQSCDQNNLINVNHLSTVNEGPKLGELHQPKYSSGLPQCAVMPKQDRQNTRAY
ncbi:hypothetical protein ElyMa_002624300 [Elysia marginata]|uniref:DUF19 domain-containing protein n=1 Tax=Elysia marginata TaxID=1093978 RepID=A0AAV4H5B8_9GAST|nr:hypothetical protein ElyMa_002624300 [Elysia marginata]